MKMEIHTYLLKELLSKAVKGATNNKLLPITSLVKIEQEGTNIKLTTTDGVNYLIVESQGGIVKEGAFYLVVEIDKLNKLVSKISKDYTVLEVDNGKLIIHADGVYNFELLLDEFEQKNAFQGYEFDTIIPKQQIETKDIKYLVKTLKSSLSREFSKETLTHYYCGEYTAATNGFAAAKTRIKLFEKPLLLSSELMNLIEIIEDEEINVQVNGEKLLFTTPSITIYGESNPNISNYPDINRIFETRYESAQVISKEILLNSLGRLRLFTNEYQRNAIHIEFLDDEIKITAEQNNSFEIIKAEKMINYVKPFKIKLDLELLLSQISSCENEEIELWYADENMLKIVSGRTERLMALLA